MIALVGKRVPLNSIRLVPLVRAPLPFQMEAHLPLGFIRSLDVGA